VLKQLPLVGFLLLISACEPISEQSSANIVSTLVPQCINSQSQCDINTDFAHFSVKFSQYQLSDNIKTELPFTIELTKLPRINSRNKSEQTTLQVTVPKTEHITEQGPEKSITKISAHIEGKDMFMGKVPVFFQPTEKNDRYLAQGLLGSCSDEQMIWRLWVTVDMAEKTQTFFVDFTSQRL
jgi:hypothetical protein